MFALSPWRVFPSPKQGICFAEGEVWALESLCSFSFFLVFLFFIVMMTYGNYLHRSMLRCTEWKCWSPGSLVPDALCKQPAGFAFPFFPPPPLFFFSLSPSLPLFSGNDWDKLHKCKEGSFAICDQLSSLPLLCPLRCELHEISVFFLCWRFLAVPTQHFDSFPVS